MARRALVVGVNTYGGENDLHACVADAQAMAEVLSRHKDGVKNFDCKVLPDHTENGSPITRPSFRAALTELFGFDGDVLLYFLATVFSVLQAGIFVPRTPQRMIGGFLCKR